MSAVALVAGMNAAVVAPSARDERPAAPLVVLTETGEVRGDLPVLARHPSPERHVRELTRGFSGRLLRLYQLAQRFAHPQKPPQPAYLLLSNNQGGFPRFGFHLDGRAMPDAAYVDLHRDGDLTGRFGAMDQIYPHELLHIIVSDLSGPQPEHRDNQVHAIGVRTDRATAFSEGFAEHAQIMAVDAEGAAPETSRLPADPAPLERATRRFADYSRALEARWSIAPKARMIFVLWFSRNEQVLRYHAVRANLFARETAIPRRLHADLYRAHLIESTIPGSPGDRPKSAARLLATEGVVSALFHRLATSAALQQQYAGDDFYRRFGVDRGSVDGVDNVYLKLFAAIRAGGYDTVSILDQYIRLFPADAAAVNDIVRATLAGQELPRARSIWLRSDHLETGTSLFDQYRGMPRSHTFDLNAASLIDLLSVPGMTPELGAAIQSRGPYGSVADVRSVPGAAPLIETMEKMERSYREHVENPEEGPRLSLKTLLYPYLWRALFVALACAAAAGALYRAVRRVRWLRVAVNGFGVAVAGLAAGWSIDPGTGWLAFAAPVVLWGLPGALIALWRTRSVRMAALVAGAWAAASVVPLVVVRPVG